MQSIDDKQPDEQHPESGWILGNNESINGPSDHKRTGQTHGRADKYHQDDKQKHAFFPCQIRPNALNGSGCVAGTVCFIFFLLQTELINWYFFVLKRSFKVSGPHTYTPFQIV